MVQNIPDTRINFRTKRCICREMTREDVYERCAWGPYDNALLSYYAFNFDKEHKKRALYYRWKGMKREWFSFDLGETGTLIGILSLRRIRRIVRTARLGLVIKPEHVNRGYGTEIVKGFMKYYFTEMGFRRLFLDVAEFNKRALHCYKKCGFVSCGAFDREYPGSYDIIHTEEYRNSEDCFFFRDGRLYARYTDMTLSRKEWEQKVAGP